MANVSAPFGFRPVRSLAGLAPNYQINPAQIEYNESHSIGTGDPVTLLAGGFIDVVAPGTTAIYGIFMGCEYYDTAQKKKIWSPAWTAPSTAIAPVTCNVCTDPNAIFEVQVGGSTSVGITQADVGANINYAGQGAPNANTGQSVAYLDVTTVGTPTVTTLPFQIYALSQKVGNDNASPYNLVEVIMNNQFFKNLTGI